MRATTVVSRLMWKMQDAASDLRSVSMLPSKCRIIDAMRTAARGE